MNAKSVNQIIIRTMWSCSATISVLSCLLRGWPDALMSIISLVGTSLLLTNVHFLKIEEKLKGILILTICGYGFLGFSILRGGERDFRSNICFD